jgi:hypothetical protein
MLRVADAPPRRAELRPRFQGDRVSMLRRADAPPRREELRPRIQGDRVSMLKMSRRATELSSAQRRAELREEQSSGLGFK